RPRYPRRLGAGGRAPKAARRGSEKVANQSGAEMQRAIDKELTTPIWLAKGLANQKAEAGSAGSLALGRLLDAEVLVHELDDRFADDGAVHALEVVVGFEPDDLGAFAGVL